MSVWRFKEAVHTGVLPLSLGTLISAPRSLNTFTVSVCPFVEAIHTGVQPSLLGMLISAPMPCSNTTVDVLPYRDAHHKAVRPSLSLLFTSTPSSTRCLTTASSPVPAASIKSRTDSGRCGLLNGKGMIRENSGVVGGKRGGADIDRNHWRSMAVWLLRLLSSGRRLREYAAKG
mgnify:CR=1 FL=1